jgi:hypothetical protein
MGASRFSEEQIIHLLQQAECDEQSIEMLCGVISGRTLDSDFLRTLESSIVSMRYHFNQPAPDVEAHLRSLSSQASVPGREFDTCQQRAARHDKG